MKLSRWLILVFIAALVVAAFAKLLAEKLEPGKPEQPVSPSVPRLGAYGVDIRQTSVSGVSSGGAMAVQMQVAHSSIMRGAGVIAGVAYDCADSSIPDVRQRLLRGAELCLTGTGGADAAFSIGRTNVAAGIPGAIDPPAHLAGQKVWLFSGYNDGSVRRAAMDAVAGYYENYVGAGNLFYQNDNHAPHALITDGYGGPCLGFNNEYINNCGYDAAGRLLEHIHGRLNPRSSAPSGAILEFDQTEFVAGATAGAAGLGDKGYVYVPTACQTQTCRVHVVFHGCRQYAGQVGTAVVEHAGYNRWADTNRLIVLYPQAAPTPPTLDANGAVSNFGNPFGCWDWWGYSELPRSDEYARKTGYQIAAVKAMLDRLAEKFAPGGSSDTFGTPQDFLAPDGTSDSVALSWKPNSAATGFNVYRSMAGTGPYTRINSQTVPGASFADRGLSPNTTYFYQVSAVDQNGVESSRTSPMSRTTAAPPPACDPYFSNNVVHVAKLRALQLGGATFAAGSGDTMGPFTDHDFSQLKKEGLVIYRVGYCP